jgi:hypothetical protein
VSEADIGFDPAEEVRRRRGAFSLWSLLASEVHVTGHEMLAFDLYEMRLFPATNLLNREASRVEATAA